MRNLSIEDSLRSWAKKMVKRYSWLTIRFEYSNDENHYLVSYYFSEKIDENNPFYKEALDFEDKINEDYLENAPLFCDEESLFKLSPSAEEFKKSIFWNFDIYKKEVQTFSFKKQNGYGMNNIPQSGFNEYALAA